MKFFYWFLSLFLFVCFSFSIDANIILKKKKFKVLFAGDVMFDWGLRKSIQTMGESVIDTELQELFESADYRVINLETPITNSTSAKPYKKSYVFRAEPEDLNILKYLNIDMALLGNNHSMDYNKEGLEDTMVYLDEYGINFAGAGKNIEQAFQPIPFSNKWQDYRIISSTQIGPASLFATKKNHGSAGYDYSVLKNIASKFSKQENNILALHWGTEYNPEPSDFQIKIAHSLIDLGYSAIIGHHPHIPQGTEKYKNGVIVYSLGNFMFGSRNQYLNHNIIVILQFEKGVLEQVEIVPIYGKFQKDPIHKFRLLTLKEADEFLYEYSVLCEKLNTKLSIKNGRGYIYFN